MQGGTVTKEQRIRDLMRRADDLIREAGEETDWNRKAMILGQAGQVVAELMVVRAAR